MVRPMGKTKKMVIEVQTDVHFPCLRVWKPKIPQITIRHFVFLCPLFVLFYIPSLLKTDLKG